MLSGVLATGLAAAGLVAVGEGLLSSGPPQARVSGRIPPPTPTQPRRSSSSRAAASSPSPGSRPLALSIPAIGVHTTLVPLGLAADGTLEVPTSFSVAGWYDLGPAPGDPGAAVVLGHVDSTSGPAVFYRLGDLAPGELVRVAREDGTDALFRVYAIREFAKSAFPTSLVYGRTRGAELRLITCGGPFDETTGHYLDNVVVFARAVAPA
jgi:sortase (surface protein transpeptidase)